MFSTLRRNRSYSTTNGGGGGGRQRLPSESLPRLPESSSDGKNSLSSSDYALKCREIMKLYGALRDLHITTIFDLPRVVVIGGQSSGKSSLVEAVSGINVPRDSGTCTRCPMDCTMTSNATSWSCTIELRRIFDKEGNPLGSPTVEAFGPVIVNRSLVEIQIRRAQAAILNPHRPSSDFFDLSEAQLRSLKDQDTLQFSKNVVQVCVKDPNSTDLTFVDLPGLIQNASDNLIKTVRELTESYIKAKNTLIVIAMPMSDDIQNIQAVTLAKASGADPRRERTIGVLTKPDTLTQGATGSREGWRAILEGQQAEHNTQHGYYCVRLPDDSERARNINGVEVERLADNFFKSTAPWSEMADRSRFGIPNFVKDISGLLIELIEKNLPELGKVVERELSRCIAELQTLPPVLSKEPTTEVLLRVSAFCQAIKDGVSGAKLKHFVQKNKDRYLEFKDDIEKTTPNFHPFEDIESNYKPLDVSRSCCRPRKLQEVRNVIKGSITWELPGHVPFDAIKILVLQYTTLWEKPSMRCFHDIVENTRVFLEELISYHFGLYKELEKYMRVLTFRERDIHRDEALVFLQNHLQLEGEPLFTQNFDALRQEQESWRTIYDNQRANRHYYSSSYRSMIYDFPEKTFSHIKDGSPSASTVDDELDIMATVQAYFQVSSKRIIDHIPLSIEHQLNQSFGSSIDTALFDAITRDTDSGQVNLRELTCEDPAVESKRKTLEDRKARLLEIMDKLDNFRQG